MKSMWDKIVDGECPWEEDVNCPIDCHNGEDYCGEMRRIREIGFREEDVKARIKREIQDIIIMRGECPMYGGKCPEGCYRTNDDRYSGENKRCMEYKIAHKQVTEPITWDDWV
jgi:hypothetical protein